MGIRRKGTFTSADFKAAMMKVCPSDADMDLEMQRLLDRMGGPPPKEDSDEQADR
jgi:hypothetical protein